MASILQEISEWAASLPYWEQASLEKVVAGSTCNDEVVEELLQYLLEDAGLATIKKSRPQLNFPQEAYSAEEKIEKIIIKSIYNLCNINALVSNQVLEFGPQLTVIFGSNGSGKSGYARVIGSAAFTRGDKQILRDVTKPANTSQPLSADFQLEVGGRAYVMHYEIGQVCQELQSFYVFDSTSVRAHLTRSNPMSFAPAGLDYLTKLAEFTDRVRKLLQQRIDKLSCENPFPMRFIGDDTEVKELITNLNSKTDISAIKKLSSLSKQEIDYIDELDRKIAELKSANIPEQIAELEQRVGDLQHLITGIRQMGENLGESLTSEIFTDIRSWQHCDSLVQNLSVDQFKTEEFTTVGTDEWYAFIKSAHDLVKAEPTIGNDYPNTGSCCLLCHQPLNESARSLIKNLFIFLSSDAQAKLDLAAQKLEAHSKTLGGLDFDILDEQQVSYRHLQECDPIVLEKTIEYVSACRNRCQALKNGILQQSIVVLEPLPNDCVSEIEEVIQKQVLLIDELKNRKVIEEIQAFTKEKLELEHRRLLKDILDEVLKYVENAKWVEMANSSKTKRSTAHITRKYNELFEQLVTQEYIRLFQETLKKLNCPLQINIVTKAQKGTTIKQIALKTDTSVTSDQAAPDKVLSEGEQRAVALADFFTEVRLDKGSCGVILDDPVTSLDFQWKETIADYIIEEASRQQVIVFTHDLHFLSLLSEHAEEKINVTSHWIQKRNEIPGWVYLDNSPIAEKDFRKPTRAKNFLDKAKQAGHSDADQEQMYLENGFGALRTTYEVFVMHDLFQDVVLRFQERVSGDRLRKVYVDEGIRDDVSESIGRLSRYITAHSHSDFNAATKPTSDLLDKEIKQFEDISQRQKKARKDRGLE